MNLMQKSFAPCTPAPPLPHFVAEREIPYRTLGPVIIQSLYPMSRRFKFLQQKNHPNGINALFD